ncbi:MAG TPA: hypothetical protein VFT22_12765 [Kofleriaceae bacterium]|nr:hypothetical protein [Kofleriaceae bacterium]
MTGGRWIAGLVALIAACDGAPSRGDAGDPAPEALHLTTSGAIAIANLDHQIAQHGDAPGIEDLLLARSRFLADYEALDRALAVAEARCPAGRCATAADHVRRARARSAVHRFADALDDLAAAERAGAGGEGGGEGGDEIVALRASIRVATGYAAEVIPALEAAVARRPGLASRSALATAYAAVGRFGDADALYAGALEALDTTSPFPYAWIYFARGLMWAEQAGDRARGEAMYRQALAHLPELVVASIHLAELEIARGAPAAATARLEQVVASSDEPEALGLAGALHIRAGDRERGRGEIARARARFEALLVRHPLAFADHAAEFYLGPGADPERAWALAQQNLAARATARAFALAIAAARATGRAREASALAARAGSRLRQ